MTKEQKKELYTVYKQALIKAYPVIDETFNYPVNELEEIINASISGVMYGTDNEATVLPTVEEIRERLNNG